MAIFLKKITIFGNFIEKNDKFFGNFLTIKCQFSGGSDSNFYQNFSVGKSLLKYSTLSNRQ